MGQAKNYCQYCYFSLTIVALFMTFCSFGYFFENSHPQLLSQPRDSNGTICTEIGLSKRYQSQQNVQKYCVSLCPTGDYQFDHENIEVYKNTETQNNNFVHKRFNHHQSQYFQEFDKKAQKSLHNNEKKKKIYNHFSSHNIEWPSIQQLPSQILGGICISDNKLDLIKQINPSMWIRLKKKQLEIKLLWLSVIIIISLIIFSVAYQLITKTNTFCCSMSKQLSIYEHNQILGPINQDDEEKIQSYSKFDKVNFVFVFILAIALILLTLIALIHQVFTSAKTQDKSIFSQILLQFKDIFTYQDSQSSLKPLQKLLVLLIIFFTVELFYLVYNAVWRYGEVIQKSLQFISKGKRNISKLKFLFYSIVGSFISVSIITIFICMIPRAVTLFEGTIIYDYTNQIYGKVNYLDQRVIAIIVPYGMVGLLSLIWLDELFLYFVTFQSVKKLRKQSFQLQSVLLTLKDLNYISRQALLKFVFFLPIKVSQFLNITFGSKKNQQNSCKRLIQSLSNQLHQLGLNRYIFYCMSEKFNLVKILNVSRQNQKYHQSQVSASIAHSLYSQSYTENTKGPSFEVYKTCQRIIKVFAVFLLLVYAQKLYLQSKEDNQLQPIYSLPLFVSLIGIIVTEFPLKFIFANAEIIELSRILLGKLNKPNLNKKY